MATKTSKTAPRPSKTATPPARKKLTLKKDALKDISAAPKSGKVKGGANYTRVVSGAL